ncbi:hypothetical protein LCGC14_0226080 [marine sediment metagenome]|uniref:Uncharacterized protein n=1 Tax=marine sediment metagenome TaxID=412755 RepID=A0A0F9UBW0_9ZZZZ|nr:hypothetical protein [Phycisphaerae bacterium]HDZ42939.1 hypothetical protein [Phycisphaerae bacterium]
MKTFAVVGVIAVVAVALLVGGQWLWSTSRGTQPQRAFFKAVGSGDPDKVLALLTAEARDDIDRPVLAAWMAAIQTRLGKFIDVSADGLLVKRTDVNGSQRIDTRANVNFEKGAARSHVVFRDGKIDSFEVTSERLGNDWFTGLADTQLYRQRGQQLLTYLLKDRPGDAYVMMHPNLQRNLPIDQLGLMIAATIGQRGRLKSVSYAKEIFSADKDGPSLTVYYSVACENNTRQGYVQFRFANLKGHVVRFDTG